MGTIHIPEKKKFMDAYDGCMEMRVTEKPDYSDLEPYFKLLGGKTNYDLEFKKIMCEIEDKIGGDRKHLKEILERLLEYAQRRPTPDKTRYKF